MVWDDTKGFSILVPNGGSITLSVRNTGIGWVWAATENGKILALGRHIETSDAAKQAAEDWHKNHNS